MDNIKITGETPIACKNLVVGDYYYIRMSEDKTLLCEFVEGTILNLVFKMIINNNNFTKMEVVKIPTMDVIDGIVTIYHLNRNDAHDMVFDACLARFGVIKTELNGSRFQFGERVANVIRDWITKYMAEAEHNEGYWFQLTRANVSVWVMSDTENVYALCLHDNGHDYVIHNNLNNPVFKINEKGYRIYASTMKYESGFNRNQIGVLTNMIIQSIFKEGEHDENISD